jgi:hypothetical protein
MKTHKVTPLDTTKLAPCERTYYHVTDASNVASILSKGLIPQAGKGLDTMGPLVGVRPSKRPPSVYLSDSLRMVGMLGMYWKSFLVRLTGFTHPAILKVKLPCDAPIKIDEKIATTKYDEQEWGGKGYRYEGSISHERISLV